MDRHKRTRSSSASSSSSSTSSLNSKLVKPSSPPPLVLLSSLYSYSRLTPSLSLPVVTNTPVLYPHPVISTHKDSQPRLPSLLTTNPTTSTPAYNLLLLTNSRNPNIIKNKMGTNVEGSSRVIECWNYTSKNVMIL